MLNLQEGADSGFVIPVLQSFSSLNKSSIMQFVKESGDAVVISSMDYLRQTVCSSASAANIGRLKGHPDDWKNQNQHMPTAAD